MNEIIFEILSLKARGFCCSQIMFILALGAQGRTNPGLVRSVGGLCFGVRSGDLCGALSGGACVISLYAGKGTDEETPDDEYQAMMAELTNWFNDESADYGGTRCSDILGRFPDRSICGRIVSETYGKCMDILASHGFDPAAGKDG